MKRLSRNQRETTEYTEYTDFSQKASPPSHVLLISPLKGIADERHQVVLRRLGGFENHRFGSDKKLFRKNGS